jgi:hypothetical protein
MRFLDKSDCAKTRTELSKIQAGRLVRCMSLQTLVEGPNSATSNSLKLSQRNGAN